MNEEGLIDVPEEQLNAGLAIAKRDAKTEIEKTKSPVTPQQMRVMEVNEALLPAYQKASTLEMSEAEINGLTLPFPDEKIEIRPHDGLIYIPHIHISNRLNQVFNPGHWSLVCRRHWLEGNTMYGEYVMLIKGCYVGESVGGHQYQPNNPKTNYSDALESTAAEALRRIAGKRLSCGDQVWDPDYARKWVAKHAHFVSGKWFKKDAPKESAPIQPTPRAPVPKVPEKEIKLPTEKTLEWMISVVGDAKERATQFCVDLGWILPTEGLMDLPLRFVPYSKQQMDSFMQCLKTWSETGKVGTPYMPHLDPDTKYRKPESKPIEVPREEQDEPGDQDAWRLFPMPFGKNAGVAMEDLEKNYLFGLWANYTVETEYKGRPKKPETIAKDQAFRAMLDLAGSHYNFQKKD